MVPYKTYRRSRYVRSRQVSIDDNSEILDEHTALQQRSAGLVSNEEATMNRFLRFSVETVLTLSITAPFTQNKQNEHFSRRLADTAAATPMIEVQ